MVDNFNPFKASAPSRKATLIIAAAQEIIANQGSEAVTRKLVAQKAGLTPADVSSVFNNRAALMRAVDHHKA